MKLNRSSFFKILFLIGVYSLHLVFIQILLEVNSIQVVESFKTFLSNTTTNQSSHPPVTAYYQLHKHYSKNAQPQVTLATPANSMVALFLRPKVVKQDCIVINSKYFPSICDDAFKRYKAHRTFLI